MLRGFPTQERRYLDPDEKLAGRCLTCGAVVHCVRRNAQKQGTNEVGVWGDMLSVECPGTIGGKTCGARVFLMGAEQFEKAFPGRKEDKLVNQV